MKIGVTGATGQLGRLVIEALKRRTKSDELVALVRSVDKASGMGVEARSFDYDKVNADALKGIDTLLLISGNEIGSRARQHENVIGAAKTAGVKRIVYTSLLRSDSSSLSLAGEHNATEAVLKSSGIDYTILRNGWYTENYTGGLGNAVASGVIAGCAGNGRISSAPRADYAEAAAVVLTSGGHSGKIYELSGDGSYTLDELAAEVSRQSGKQITYKNMAEADYVSLLVNVGLPEGFAKAVAGWDTSASVGDLFGDSHQLSQLIGRKTTPMADVVKATLAAL